MQPILPVATTSGATLGDIADLALAEFVGELRLEHVVGPGGAAAEMALGNLGDRKAGLVQQLDRQGVDALTMLQRARRVIGDLKPVHITGGISPISSIYSVMSRASPAT